ncbi:MAG TPA: energy transducer TonB [Longimicrobium sp.]|nr:energy transducer TonB [Longimicrobium sp.]
MSLRHPRAGLPGTSPARLTVVALLAAAAWLGAAAPAAGQQTGGAARFGLEPPRLLNPGQLRPLADTLLPSGRPDSGSVSLKFGLRADGTVDPASVVVERASDSAFVAAATAVAPRLRFTPATLDGRAVPVWIRHRVSFPLSAETPREPPEDTYEMSPVEVQPALRNHRDVAREVAARYPPALREAGVTGVVILRFRVTANGTVDPATIAAELVTDPAFEEPAAAVVRMMRFRPAEMNGKPVPVWVTIPINFQPPASPAARS